MGESNFESDFQRKEKFRLGRKLFYQRKYGEAKKIFEVLFEDSDYKALIYFAECFIQEWLAKRKSTDLYINNIKSLADIGLPENACICAFVEELSRQNEKEAISYLKKAADLRNIEAMYILGSIYMYQHIDNYGEISYIEKNEKEAVELWTYCAKRGDYLAMCELGWAYREGEGVEEDKEKGMQLMDEAYRRSKGTIAHYKIAAWLVNDWIKEKKFLKVLLEGLRGAYIGNRNSWWEIIGGFVSGLRGVQLPYFGKDYKNALNCYLHSNEFVNNEYLSKLICEIEKNDVSDPDMMYLLGRGYDKLGDNKKGAEYYIRACEMNCRGNRLAARELLYLLYEEDVDLNEENVLELVEKSIEFSNEEITRINDKQKRKEEKVNAYKCLQQAGAFALVRTYYGKFKDKRKIGDNQKRYNVMKNAAECNDIECIRLFVSFLDGGEFDDITEIFDKQRTILYWMNRALKNDLFPYENASYLDRLDKKRYVKNYRDLVKFDQYITRLDVDGITFVRKEGTDLFDYVAMKSRKLNLVSSEL